MKTINIIIHGLGNIGRHVLECVERAPDMECLGVIRRPESLGKNPSDLRSIPDFSDLSQLMRAKGQPDVAILCGPSRQVPQIVAMYLEAGINTVDSFDIHQDIRDVIHTLTPKACRADKTAIVAAGWDPGTDSVWRALFEAMAPIGTTFTNFGRGRSMGHSVAARGVPGVRDAIAITIPMGGGRHSRLVYVLPEIDADFSAIKARLATEPYFANDPLTVERVDSVEALARVADNAHGVEMERVGASGYASNQRLHFDMRIDNPALTAQVLTSCARAAVRLPAGAYTLIDVPPVHLLPGERLDNIQRLV